MRGSGGTAIHGLLVVALLALVAWRLLLPALSADEYSFAIASDATGGGWSRDFVAILTFAKAAWRGAAGYDVASFLRVTREALGWPVPHALPFPYSPTMLWLLAPFCALPLTWAYVAWTLLAVAAVWWMTRARSALWLLVACFSPTAFWCFRDGQTAFLSTAALLFLMVRDLDRGRSPRADWPDATVLWALGAKPPLALTAGLVLLLRGRWRPLVMAVGATVVTTAALTPLLGIDWIHDYVWLVGHYDRDTADPVYVTSLVPELMGNLRALLHVTMHFPDASAVRWSAVAWIIALGGLIVVARSHEIRGEAIWSFAALAYLLFCPHVTGTEDLLLLLILALVCCGQEDVSVPVRWMTIVTVLLALSMTSMLGRDHPVHVPVTVAAKIVLIGVVSLEWGSWRRDLDATAALASGTPPT
jgi:hypothetical protein